MKHPQLLTMTLIAFFLGGCSVHDTAEVSVVDPIDIQSSPKELQQHVRLDLEARLFGL